VSSVFPSRRIPFENNDAVEAVTVDMITGTPMEQEYSLSAIRASDAHCAVSDQRVASGRRHRQPRTVE
jgi:hypothetical protein